MRHLLPIVIIAACFATVGVAIARDLPQAVLNLSLKDIEMREKPLAEYGSRVRGTLPSGSRVEIELDGRTVIEDIECRGNDLFPVSDITVLFPLPITENEAWPADARLEKIEFEGDERIEIKGRLSDGREFEAEFAIDGRLLDFEQTINNRRVM